MIAKTMSRTARTMAEMMTGQKAGFLPSDEGS
jgi:hypothetical protein